MIIKLSEKESTFFDFPPDGEYKEFNLQQMEYLALKLCEIDKHLAKMSVKLIRRTKLKEYDFWRNYFYHVYGIEKSYLEKAERWLGKSGGNNNSNKLPSPLPDISNNNNNITSTSISTTVAAASSKLTPIKSPSPVVVVENTINKTTATTTTTSATVNTTGTALVNQPINNTIVDTSSTTVPASLYSQSLPIQSTTAVATAKTATPSMKYRE